MPKYYLVILTLVAGNLCHAADLNSDDGTCEGSDQQSCASSWTDETSLIQTNVRMNAKSINDHQASNEGQVDENVESERNLLATVTPTGPNLAKGKPTSQHSIWGNVAVSSRAVDGNVIAGWGGGSCTATKDYSKDPWWQVDLGEIKLVNTVRVLNRANCCPDRLNGFQVRVGMSSDAWKNPQCIDPAAPTTVADGAWAEVDCGGLEGDHVGIVRDTTSILTLCEVEVYGTDPTTTTTPPTTTTTMPPAEPIADTDSGPECVAKPAWHAGYGSCTTYAPGLITNGAENYAYCDIDKSRQGIFAKEVCEECGQCYRLPSCADVPNWHAGYGACATYVPGLMTNGAENYAYCDIDVSRAGVSASDACEECGKCSISNPSTMGTVTTPTPGRSSFIAEAAAEAEAKTEAARRFATQQIKGSARLPRIFQGQTEDQ